MFSTLITVALFVSFVIRGASAGFAISTPKLIQCEPVQISWAPAVSPYLIEVVSASDLCGNALDTMHGLTSTIVQYESKFAAGTRVVLYISDAAGNEAWSGTITIGASSNSTCLPSVSSANTPSNVTAGTPAIVSSPATHLGSSATPSSNPSLGGAINAGTNTNAGDHSVRQASIPLLSITALAAMFTLTL